MKIEELEDKINFLSYRMDVLENLVRERALKTAQKLCHHNFMKWGSCGGSICIRCSKRGGWYCPDSPDHQCQYSKTHDQCDYCGQPEERK